MKILQQQKYFLSVLVEAYKNHNDSNISLSFMGLQVSSTLMT